MNRRIKVLCIPSDREGVGLHRSLAPHIKLDEMYGDRFEVTIMYDIDWSDKEALSKYDIVHIHRGIYEDMDGFLDAMKFCKEVGVTTVMDLDDYWSVNSLSPLYEINREYSIDKMITKNIQSVDYVTTTTDIFAEKIRKFNKNVKVFPNALDASEMESLKEDRQNGRLRFGFIMGSSHESDMELFRGTVNRLPKSVLDKVQFVLCGYDLRGVVKYVDSTGKLSERPIKPNESVWYAYERNVTDDFKIVSSDYKDFLMKFKEGPYSGEDDEPYKRRWTKTVKEYDYMKHYNDIDVLLVPLKNDTFNECKSELKLVEAGMMGKAVIASDFGPYTIGTRNFFEKGGKVNTDGNCILIDNMKAHKGWAKAIEKLVSNPEYVTILKNNLHNDIVEKYDIRNVTKKRAEWYETIVK